MVNRYPPLLTAISLLSISLQAISLEGFRCADESFYTAPLEELLSGQFERLEEQLKKSSCFNLLDKSAAERPFNCNHDMWLIFVLKQRLELYRANAPAELQKNHSSHDFALYQQYFNDAKELVAQEHPELVKALELRLGKKP